MATGGDCARHWRFDELRCKSEQFLVCVFFDIVNDLFLRVSWVGVCGVFDAALDSDCANRLEFVCVGHDVADLGVVCSEDSREIQGSTCDDGFVFRAV